MKISKLHKRLRTDRPMATISIRMPEDVIKDLKRIAPLLGFSGYQPLIRAYVGQGLRVDIQRIEERPEITTLINSLRKRGVAQEIISSAVAESRVTTRAV